MAVLPGRVNGEYQKGNGGIERVSIHPFALPVNSPRQFFFVRSAILFSSSSIAGASATREAGFQSRLRRAKEVAAHAASITRRASCFDSRLKPEEANLGKGKE